MSQVFAAIQNIIAIYLKGDKNFVKYTAKSLKIHNIAPIDTTTPAGMLKMFYFYLDNPELFAIKIGFLPLETKICQYIAQKLNALNLANVSSEIEEITSEDIRPIVPILINSKTADFFAITVKMFKGFKMDKFKNSINEAIKSGFKGLTMPENPKFRTLSCPISSLIDSDLIDLKDAINYFTLLYCETETLNNFEFETFNELYHRLYTLDYALPFIPSQSYFNNLNKDFKNIPAKIELSEAIEKIADFAIEHHQQKYEAFEGFKIPQIAKKSDLIARIREGLDILNNADLFYLMLDIVNREVYFNKSIQKRLTAPSILSDYIENFPLYLVNETYKPVIFKDEKSKTEAKNLILSRLNMPEVFEDYKFLELNLPNPQAQLSKVEADITLCEVFNPQEIEKYADLFAHYELKNPDKVSLFFRIFYSTLKTAEQTPKISIIDLFKPFILIISAEFKIPHFDILYHNFKNSAEIYNFLNFILWASNQ